MFTQDRNQMRQFFVDVWRKNTAPGSPTLEPLEKLVATVIEQHPEYHGMLLKPEAALTQDFLPEGGHSNPFLHMSMHIAIQEQLGSRKPEGINAIWGELVRHHNSAHEAEHRMMECLAETLWQAQNEHREPDQTAYLRQLQALLEIS